MLSETNQVDRDPRRNFYRDMKKFLKELMPDDNNNNNNITPILLGDLNDKCKGTSTSQKLCDEFGLRNAFLKERSEKNCHNFTVLPLYY
jgi:hypothetical protein